jgi:hypothetical protein
MPPRTNKKPVSRKGIGIKLLRLRAQCQACNSTSLLHTVMYAALLPRPADIWPQIESILFAVDPVQNYEARAKLEQQLTSVGSLITETISNHQKGFRPNLPQDTQRAIPGTPYIKCFDLSHIDPQVAILFSMWGEQSGDLSVKANVTTQKAVSIVKSMIQDGWLLPESARKPNEYECVVLCRGLEVWCSLDQEQGATLVPWKACMKEPIRDVSQWILQLSVTSKAHAEEKEEEEEAQTNWNEYIQAMMQQLANAMFVSGDCRRKLFVMLEHFLPLSRLFDGGTVFAEQLESICRSMEQNNNKIPLVVDHSSIWYWVALETAMTVCVLTNNTDRVTFARKLDRGNMEYVATQLLVRVM